MAEIDDLFQAALGLAEPWQVMRTEFDATARRLDLYLDFPRGARYACPEGDQRACPVHDTEPKTWRHLDAPKPRVLFATEGRDHSTVERFAADLAAHGGDPMRVRDVSADMSQAFERGVRASLPKAYLTYDRYHLASHATKAVDQVRRAEAKARPELKGTRYA